jgi:hypothetical protein
MEIGSVDSNKIVMRVLLVCLFFLTGAMIRSATSASLQRLLNRDDYIEFAKQLPQAEELKPEQKAYLAGVLAYRRGRFKDAINPLTSAVNAHETSLTPNQVESALELLGNDAVRTNEYGASAQMYDDVDKTFGKLMGATAVPVKEKGHIGALLQHVKPQTVQIAGDFSLRKTGKEYPIIIDGKPFSAELGTGTSF